MGMKQLKGDEENQNRKEENVMNENEVQSQSKREKCHEWKSDQKFRTENHPIFMDHWFRNPFIHFSFFILE